jgi:hypothetical protein
MKILHRFSDAGSGAAEADDDRVMKQGEGGSFPPRSGSWCTHRALFFIVSFLYSILAKGEVDEIR